MSLTKASYSMITGAPVNVLDYGADPTGLSDSAAAIQAAIDDCAGNSLHKTVILPAGNYRIGSTIQIKEGVAVVGEGNTTAFANGAQGYPSRITKASTMTDVGVELTGFRARLENVSVLSENGAAGSGIWIKANYCALINVASNGHAALGIKIGAEAGNDLNCNCWYLERITAASNGTHGVYIADLYATPGNSNVNAGVFIAGDIRSNGGTGLLLGNQFRNTFINILVENNTGYGIRVGANAFQCTFIGGDTDEGNTAGNVLIEGYNNTFFGCGGSSFVDNGLDNQIVGYAGSKFVYPTLGLTNIIGAAASNLALLTVRNTTTPALTGRGSQIKFEVPNTAAPYYRLGGAVSVQNTALPDLCDFMVLYVNTQSKGYLDYLNLDGRDGYGVYPGEDNFYSLGVVDHRWSQVFAGNGTINTSDAREKQDVEQLDAAERRVAVALKGLVKKYRFKDAVAKKGNDARIHVGVLAQEVVAAFAAEGLDAHRYSLLCYDKWDEEPEVTGPELDEKGNETGNTVVLRKHRPAGDRYGIRYDQLLAFMVAAL